MLARPLALRRLPPSLLLLALSVLLAGTASALPGRAQSPYLVQDLNSTFVPASSRPRELAERGRYALFLADGSHRHQLWRSNGTPAGTFPLAETCGGDCGEEPFLVANPPLGAFYSVYSNGGGELWLTKGRPGDVVRLAGTAGGGLDFRVRRLPAPVWVESLGRLFFVAHEPALGDELWVSDGTVAGTNRLDLYPGSGSSLPESLTVVGGRVFFTAASVDSQGAPLTGLWVSDGTSEGTGLVRRFPAQGSRGRPDVLTPVGSRVVFVAPTPGRGEMLWRSDGTEAGTVPFADLVRGAGDARIEAIHPAGRIAFFFVLTRLGEQLWVTDGTAKGTLPLTLTGVRPLASDDFAFSTIVPAGEGRRFYFAGTHPGHGYEPWVTDGTLAGTRQVAEVCPGPCSGATSFQAGGLGRRALFLGQDPASGSELWATDGTAAGTRRLTELLPGTAGAIGLATVRQLPGKALFLAYAGAHWLLGASDGTPAGTAVLTGDERVEPRVSFVDGVGLALASAFAADRLFFPATDAAQGEELWSTDGTPSGTKLVADLAPGLRSDSDPSRFLAVGDRLFFQADDGTHGFQLWSSDGTGAGTQPAAPSIPGSDFPDFFLDQEPFGEDLYFLRYQDPTPTLWKSDGSAAAAVPLPPSIVQILDLSATEAQVFFTARVGPDRRLELWQTGGSAGTARVASFDDTAVLGRLASRGGRLYFSHRTVGASGARIELWSSDGTEAGTAPVRLLGQDAVPVTAVALTPLADGLYFVVPGSESQVWRSDGTEAGTVRLFSAPGSPAFNPAFVPASAGRVVVFAGGEVWVTDGTQAGSAPIRAAAPPRFDGVVPPAGAAGVVYYSAFPSGSTHPSSLWRTDGTEAGTRPVLDGAGKPVEDPTALQGFAGRLYATAKDGADQALWVVETPSAPARVVRDLGPRPTAGWLDELEVAGGRLYFAAESPENGIELWALGEE